MNLTLPFKKMNVSDDELKVSILSEYISEEVTIKMSVLQLAKIFGVDKEVIKEMEGNKCCGYGSVELEEKCKEIREVIKKFPEYSGEGKTIIIKDISIYGPEAREIEKDKMLTDKI